MGMFYRKQEPGAFDTCPAITNEMPARPYRILHANLTFFSDEKCLIPVPGANLLVLRCEDPAQKFQVVECMPTRKQYRQSQIVSWEINKDKLWGRSWYVNPDTGRPERAWAQAVEFTGRVVIPE